MFRIIYEQILFKNHGVYFDTKDCNATISTDGNWGQWCTWSTCSIGCNQTRTRVCDDPSPSGGGWYCSKDGSNSTETRNCIGGDCTGSKANDKF